MSDTQSAPNDVVGKVVPMGRRPWTSTDVLLYALGIGAGVDELAFTTENTRDTPLRVFPTIAVVLEKADDGLTLALGEFDGAMALHGEQEVVLHRPIPAEGELESVTTITGIYDKGSGAVVATETESKDVATGEALFTTRSSMFVRGRGGWGGDRGPSVSGAAPDGSPNLTLTQTIGADLALLYRLSGDRNPLHSDPAFARDGGYDRPILHGLATFGIVGRGLLHELCDSDPARLRRIRARFSAPAYPGDTLTTSVWKVGDGQVVFETARDGSEVVIRNGELDYS